MDKNNSMLFSALREFTSGPLNQLFVNLAGKDGERWLEEFKKFLRKEPCWVSFGKNSESSLLNFLGTITVPATTKQFVARERFVVNTSDSAPVKISYLGDDFPEWFLAGESKVEGPLPKQKLRYSRLEKSSMDGPITAELGGEGKAETTLSEVFALMAKQANGKKGALLNNRRANIFYVRDQKGVLRTVRVLWGDHGWLVLARELSLTLLCSGGSQVFSRNY